MVKIKLQGITKGVTAGGTAVTTGFTNAFTAGGDAVSTGGGLHAFVPAAGDSHRPSLLSYFDDVGLTGLFTLGQGFRWAC
jgi:hypothetical protein